MLNLLVKNWKTKGLKFFVSFFFHVICKVSNFNMWTANHLAQASCAELTLLPATSLAAVYPIEMGRNSAGPTAEMTMMLCYFPCVPKIFKIIGLWCFFFAFDIYNLSVQLNQIIKATNFLGGSTALLAAAHPLPLLFLQKIINFMKNQFFKELQKSSEN